MLSTRLKSPPRPLWLSVSLFLLAASCAAQTPPPIPIGLDAYRSWDHWPDQRIGMRHVVIVQTRALGAEQDAGAQIPPADRTQLGGRTTRGQQRLDDVPGTRARRQNMVQVGNRISHTRVDGRLVE